MTQHPNQNFIFATGSNLNSPHPKNIPKNDWTTLHQNYSFTSTLEIFLNEETPRQLLYAQSLILSTVWGNKLRIDLTRFPLQEHHKTRRKILFNFVKFKTKNWKKKKNHFWGDWSLKISFISYQILYISIDNLFGRRYFRQYCDTIKFPEISEAGKFF